MRKTVIGEQGAALKRPGLWREEEETIRKQLTYFQMTLVLGRE